MLCRHVPRCRIRLNPIRKPHANVVPIRCIAANDGSAGGDNMNTTEMSRSIDLVIAFTAAKKTTVSSAQTRKEAQRAQRQYDQLINTLTYNHLHAVGRRGESLGHLLVFISCPREVLDTLVRKER
jgi:hypothetical protein